jgi:hypothetical protein
LPDRGYETMSHATQRRQPSLRSGRAVWQKEDQGITRPSAGIRPASKGVAQRGGIAIGAPYVAKLDSCFASRQFRCYDAELPDYYTARSAVAPVLNQEESFAAWHDAHAESWKIGIEGSVVFGRDRYS